MTCPPSRERNALHGVLGAESRCSFSQRVCHLSNVVRHSAQRGLSGFDDLRSEACILVTPLEGEWKHVIGDGVEDLEELGGDGFAP